MDSVLIYQNPWQNVTLLLPLSVREMLSMNTMNRIHTILTQKSKPRKTSSRKKPSDCHNETRRYRAYPTDEQITIMLQTIGCCRYLYNQMKANKDDAFEKTGKLIKILPTKYKSMERSKWLNDVDSLALSNVQRPTGIRKGLQ